MSVAFTLIEAAFAELIGAVDRALIAAARNAAIIDPTPVDTSNLAEWERRITQAAHDIHALTQRAPANHILLSSEAAARLEQHPAFEPDRHYRRSAAVDFSLINHVGTFAEKFHVLVDPLFPVDELFMGYAGPSLLDAGAVFGPYAFVLKPTKLSSGSDGFEVRLRNGYKLLYPTYYSRMFLK